MEKEIAKEEELEKYISNYKGDIQIFKLKSLAMKNFEKAQEPYAMAVELAYQRKKVGLYSQLYSFHKAKSNMLDKHVQLPPYDSDWVRTLDLEYKKRAKIKDNEITSAIASHLKDSIRLAYMEAGNVDYEFGYLHEAYKHYSKAFDYSVDPEDQVSAAIQFCLTSIGLDNFSYIYRYCENVSNLEILQKSKHNLLLALHGIGLMVNEKYFEAGHKFINVSLEFEEDLKEVMTSSDLAIYISICSFYTFHRKTIIQNIQKNPKVISVFENAMELHTLIEDFASNKYKGTLKALHKLPLLIKNDSFLYGKSFIIQRIIEKIIIQYVAPYKTLDLKRMSEDVAIELDDLENMISHLSGTGKLNIRIDSHKKVMYMKKDDEKIKSFRTAIKSGNKFIQSTEELFLRVQCQKDKLTLKRPTATGIDVIIRGKVGMHDHHMMFRDYTDEYYYDV